MEVYIIAILVSLLLIVILFFALRSTVKRIDHNTKKFFLDKLQDYDYLIEEKQKVLDDLCDKIEDKKNDLENLNCQMPTLSNEKKEKYYNNDKIPVYSDENIFKKYKAIKEKFSFDYESIVNDFIKDNLKEDNADYYIAVDIKNKLNKEEIFKILNLKKSEQKQYILSLMTKEQKQFLLNFMKEFEIKKLVLKLDDFLEKNDPKVYVYVGKENKNLSLISDKVEVVVDNNINEGMKISYKGILYDYSL